MNQTLQFLCEKFSRENSHQTVTQPEPHSHSSILNNNQRLIQPPPHQTQTQTNKGEWRTKKLDLPIFSGENPDGWIMQAERYFHFYGLSEEEIMEAAVVSLAGKALAWFQWEHQEQPLVHWEELKDLLLRQFRPQDQGTLHEQWLCVQQTGSVADYQLEFIEKANPLGRVPSNILFGTFMKGLKEDLRREVRAQGPQTLKEAMIWANRIEQKMQPISYVREPLGVRRYQPPAITHTSQYQP